MAKTIMVRATLVALAGSATLAAHAVADAPKRVDVPAGELAEALEVLTRQAAVDLVFQSGELRSIRTEGVSGVYSPQEAVRILLKGTSLQLHTDSTSGAMVIAAPSSRTVAPKPIPLSATGQWAPAPAEGRSFWSRIVLAQNDTTSTAQERRGRGQDQDVPAAAAAAKDVPLEEIVVTGSSIRGQEAPVGSPLVSVSRQDIVRVAPQTTRDLIATLPQFTQFNVAPTPNVFFTEAPNLRGLGVGTTLTLLNGHRILGPGLIQAAFDPATIPTAAIERVEVVADGASAIYGSDAVAGVINVYTRRAFDGAEFQARAGFADGYTAHSYSATLGQTWSSGSALLAYEHSDNDSLSGADRSYITADLRSVGGLDNRVTNTDPPNVVINGVTYAYPALLPGTVNLRDQVEDQDFVPDNDRDTVLATVRQSLNDRVDVFADLVYSKSTAAVDFALTNFNSFTFVMNNTNPYFIAPPGTNATFQTVRYSFGNVFGHSKPVIDDGDARDISLGTDVKLGSDWNLRVLGTYGESRMEQNQTVLDFATAFAAANGTTLDTAFDPFTGRTNPAILARIQDTRFTAFTEQELRELSAKADGPLFSWFGGTLRGALGVQGREEEVIATQNLGPISTATPRSAAVTRRVKAAFAELLVPFVDGEGRPGLRQLDLSLAARTEDYDSFGRTTNPKLGLNWSPADAVRFRSSYGTSFRAPALTDLASVANGVQVLPNNSSPGVLTPPGSPPLNVLNIFGSNPSLGPEESESFTFGIELNPAALEGFRASATWFDIDYDNVIAMPQGRFTNPSLSFTYILRPTEAQIDQLTRGLPFAGVRFQPGQTDIIVDSRPQNLGVQRMQGIDYEVSERWNSSWGDFVASVAGTYLAKFETQATVSSLTVNQFIAASTVRNRIRGSLAWRKGSVAAGLAGNYTGGYRLLTPAQDVSSFFTVDANASWDLPFSGWLAESTIGLNIQNVLDEEPPVYLASPGFDSARSNPLGRTVSVSLGKRFDW
jgi:iron complex outermembrane receptor protein